MFSSSPYWEVNFFATILEDALMDIRILDECNNKLRIYKMKTDMADLHRKKYGVIRSVKDELYGVDPNNLENEHYKLNKLEADRKFCKDLLMSTYLDMSINHCFEPLINNRKDIESRNSYYLTLTENEAKNKIYNRELIRNLRQQRNKIKSAVYETNIVVDKLQAQVEEAALHEQARGRYINNWQNSRAEQQAYIIHGKEEAQTDTITYYRKKCDEEQRVHTELELIHNIRIDDILKNVDKWMNKYDCDMEAMDLKIERCKTDVIDQREKRLQMEKMLAEREVEMNEWKQFKIDREEAHRKKLKMIAAAIAVQAWWRGLLVRLELGPYKPSKIPPKPEKNKKKSKLILV